MAFARRIAGISLRQRSTAIGQRWWKWQPGGGATGEVYALERDRHGPHGRIMKYDLSKA